MKIELKPITVRELSKEYKNGVNTGVVGYDNKLDIRPPFQREFVYSDRQQQAVISSVMNGFPLGIMYWAKNSEDNFEVIDGQQRTISLCQYIHGKFDFNRQYFYNLPKEDQEKILNYEIMVYFCEGNTTEKMKWFETINIAGEKLTNQELRNAVYPGSWLASARTYFSKTNCAAYRIGSEYMSGKVNRQDYLETVLKWISGNDIEDYMATHQHDSNADELFEYFSKAIKWFKATFPVFRSRLMKGLPIGEWYNTYGTNKYDSGDFEKEIKRLIADDDVTKKKGIYEYLLTGNENKLSIRTFSMEQSIKAFEAQKGVCPICGKVFTIEEMQADHITPWSKGGKTSDENLQMLCQTCNRTKSNK